MIYSIKIFNSLKEIESSIKSLIAWFLKLTIHMFVRCANKIFMFKTMNANLFLKVVCNLTKHKNYVQNVKEIWFWIINSVSTFIV